MPCALPPDCFQIATRRSTRLSLPFLSSAAKNGLRTFACSETQKFGHVTFFWNGNRSGYFDEALETYVEIPSDNCVFNQKPLMKATEITDAGYG